MVDSDSNSSSTIVGGVVKGSVVVVDSNPKAKQFFLFVYRIYKKGREGGRLCCVVCEDII